jgi:hypothetical protein
MDPARMITRELVPRPGIREPRPMSDIGESQFKGSAPCNPALVRFGLWLAAYVCIKVPCEGKMTELGR